MNRRGAWLAMLWVACAPAPAPEPAPGRTPQGIYGGTLSIDDPAVFTVSVGGGECTGTLIAPRTILTAAHCAEGLPVVFRNPPSSALKFFALEVQRYSDAHPDGGATADLALFHLNEAPPVTPAPWLWDPADVTFGTPVRIVGYGQTESGSVGVRRTVTTTVSGFTSAAVAGIGLALGDATKGSCYGDSGGPAFVRTDAGVERVAAVTSYGVMCPAGVSVFLPPYRTFIEDWLRTHEDAGCPRDDRCVPGCTPIDPDCACAADSQCTAACTDLLDPDCPVNCKADGVCSAQACPLLDLDCRPLGGACIRPNQCEGRQCIGDPQHPSTYCSFSCGAGCPAGFTCDAARGVCIQPQLPTGGFGEACDAGVFCTGGGACLEGACRLGCSSSFECLSGDQCRSASPRYCVAADVTLPALNLGLPAAPAPKGCSAAPGAFAWLVLLGGCAKRRPCVRSSPRV